MEHITILIDKYVEESFANYPEFREKHIEWVQRNKEKLLARGFKFVEINTLGGVWGQGKKVPMVQPVDTMHVVRFYKRNPKLRDIKTRIEV